MGPFSASPTSFEIEIFDANDIKGYLRGRGLKNLPSADYVTAEVNVSDLDESPNDSSLVAISFRVPDSLLKIILKMGCAPFTFRVVNLEPKAFPLTPAKDGTWGDKLSSARDSSLSCNIHLIFTTLSDLDVTLGFKSVDNTARNRSSSEPGPHPSTRFFIEPTTATFRAQSNTPTRDSRQPRIAHSVISRVRGVKRAIMNRADYLREREDRIAERERLEEEDREVYRYLMAYTTPMPFPESPVPAPDYSRLISRNQSSGNKPNISEFLAMDHLEERVAQSTCNQDTTVSTSVVSAHHISETAEDFDEKFSVNDENLRLQDVRCLSPSLSERSADIPAPAKAVLKADFNSSSASLVQSTVRITELSGEKHVKAKGHPRKISKTSPTAKSPDVDDLSSLKRYTSADLRTIACFPTSTIRAQQKTPYICREQRQRWQKATIMARISGSAEDLKLWKLDAKDYRTVYGKHYHELTRRLSDVILYEDGLGSSGYLDNVATWIARGNLRFRIFVWESRGGFEEHASPAPLPSLSRTIERARCRTSMILVFLTRKTGFALYRSLLEQCVRIPLPTDLPSRGPVNPIKHLIRKKFRQNLHHDSPRLVVPALKTGYTAEKLIHAASTGNRPAVAQIHDLLRLLDAQALAGREACTQPVPRDIKKHKASLRAYPGAAKVVESRPLPLSKISKVRHVPSLTVATWLPFLRFKKRQSPYLSRVLTAKIKQRVKRSQHLEDLADMIEMGEMEDLWDDFVLEQVERERGVDGVMEFVQEGWDEGELWRTESEYSRYVVSQAMERESQRVAVLGNKFMGILEWEKELWADERVQRKRAKNQRNLSTKHAKKAVIEKQQGQGAGR
ncbi:hypothetical protein JHW43_000657 [Diplocarpon mali]|nr:hypothetical protein JHW43_000657 [Diplocarpon mali]